jgi:maleate isomerase
MTTEELDTALDHLPLRKLDLIVYHCTSGAIVGGHQGIKQHIEELTGLPVITTAHSVIAALSYVRARKLLLVTPYIEEINRLEVTFLVENGFNVSAVTGEEMNDGYTIQDTPLEVIASWVLGGDTHHSDTVFISCTGLRSVDITERLEREIAQPVITSTGATIWCMLKHFGLEPSLSGYGRLLSGRI